MTAGGALITRAPVRISFGGGGTDLTAYYERYGGLVVSAAITRYCYVEAADAPRGGLRVDSADYGLGLSFPRGVAPTVAEPLVLPRAALEWFYGLGLRQRGVALRLRADVPPGTGLGSSSAMAVALVRALAARCDAPLDAAAAAELASWLEIERLGMPIGKQDQYASAFGGLNAIEFRTDGVRVTPLLLAPSVVAALEERLLLFATGQSRQAATILRQQQADTVAKPAVVESLHELKALASAMVAALRRADLDGFGRLLDDAWQRKKRLSARVSSVAIDGWYAAARAAGALGGKIAGAGGGGFLLLYCPPSAQPALRAAMARQGLTELPFAFDFAGARVAAVSTPSSARSAPAPGGGRAEPLSLATSRDSRAADGRASERAAAGLLLASPHAATGG